MRQNQQSGDGGQQLQAGRDIVVQGVSPADVVEITRVEIARVLADLSNQAGVIAGQRLDRFGARVVDEFGSSPELHRAFADPDFQFSLQDAGRAAVSNDDAHTEALLVQLLKNRAQKGNVPRVRLATSQAILAADKLSIEALNGITAHWAIAKLSSVDRTAWGELEACRSTAEALVGGGLLPETESGWIDDAAVLNLIQTQPAGIGSRKRYRDWIREKFDIGLNPGFSLEENATALAAVQSRHPSLIGKVANHPFRPGFGLFVELSAEQLYSGDEQAVMRDDAELAQLVALNGFGTIDPEAQGEFDQRLNDSPAIAATEAWWNGLPVFDFTVTGNVVGFVNARRYMEFQGADTVADLLSIKAAPGTRDT